MGKNKNKNKNNHNFKHHHIHGGKNISNNNNNNNGNGNKNKSIPNNHNNNLNGKQNNNNINHNNHSPSKNKVKKENWSVVKQDAITSHKEFRRIEFSPSSKSNYSNLNASSNNQSNQNSNNNNNNNISKDIKSNKDIVTPKLYSKGNNGFQGNSKVKVSDCIFGPSPGLFDPSLVEGYINWKKMKRSGPGLYNHGNTCFLNSTLQCLVHIAPFTQLLMEEAAKSLRGFERFDSNKKSMLQFYQKFVVDFWSPSPGKSVSPRSMVQNIRRVGKQFRPMRQEDAHEYLRQLLDCFHEECLKVNKKKTSDGKISETTLISRVFGGYLCNELKCSSCSYSSKTYNHFQDLSLELSGGISSIKDSLKAFIKPEKLSSGNEWKCDGCKKKVQVFQ
jgi:ubiquitin C-terminal hydrolase